jgi:hypothetical protein
MAVEDGLEERRVDEAGLDHSGVVLGRLVHSGNLPGRPARRRFASLGLTLGDRNANTADD